MKLTCFGQTLTLHFLSSYRDRHGHAAHAAHAAGGATAAGGAGGTRVPTVIAGSGPEGDLQWLNGKMSQKKGDALEKDGTTLKYVKWTTRI